MSGDRISLKELRERPIGTDEYTHVPTAALLALVEAVEAAQRMRAKHGTRSQWILDKRVLDNALARFKDYEGEQT